MKSKIQYSLLGLALRGAALALIAAATPRVQAANIFWTGPTNSFTHDSFSVVSDKLTTNHVGGDSANNVWLTRGTQFPLYNAAAESTWNGSGPLNTLWALASGPLTNAASLTYNTFASVVGRPGAGASPGLSVGKTFYVKIVSDNIYFSLTLTAWGNNNGGSFTYARSSPAVVAPPPTPTVSITNPAGGAVFAAPANLKLGASASVAGGTVTNVQFFANAGSLGSVTATPFNLTSGSLGAGPFALTAVATAGGISATSAPVNVTVVNPVAVALSGPGVNGGQFSFNYTADSGLRYVVQSSSNLVDWSSLATNVAAGSSVPFSDPFNPTGPLFYRVGRMPNP